MYVCFFCKMNFPFGTTAILNFNIQTSWQALFTGPGRYDARTKLQPQCPQKSWNSEIFSLFISRNWPPRIIYETQREYYFFLLQFCANIFILYRKKYFLDSVFANVLLISAAVNSISICGYSAISALAWLPWVTNPCPHVNMSLLLILLSTGSSCELKCKLPP